MAHEFLWSNSYEFFNLLLIIFVVQKVDHQKSDDANFMVLVTNFCGVIYKFYGVQVPLKISYHTNRNFKPWEEYWAPILVSRNLNNLGLNQ